MQKGGDAFRLKLWEQAPSILFTNEALPHPTGGVDTLHGFRPLIGYGPDTLEDVLPHYYGTIVGQTLENRFHNLAWDKLFSFGILGLTSYLTLFSLVFFHGYRWLGLISSSTSARAFWATLIIASTAGTGFFIKLFGVGFAGLGLQGGIISGIVLFAMGISLNRSPTQTSRPPIEAALVIAILAGLAAHFIDTAFAFSMAPTATLFWIYLGILLAVWRGLESPAAKEPAHSRPSKRKMQDSRLMPMAEGNLDRPVLVASAITALGIVTLLFSFLHEYSFDALSIGHVLSLSLLTIHSEDGHSSLMLLAILSFWLAASFALIVDSTAKGKDIPLRILQTLCLSGTIGLFYALGKSGQIVNIGPIPIPLASTSLVLNQSRGYEALLIVCFGVFLAILSIAGFALAGSHKSATPATLRGKLAAAAASVTALVAMWVLAVGPLRADMSSQWGSALESLNRPLPAVEIYRRTAALNPRHFVYHQLLAELLLSLAEQTPDPERARSFMKEAESQLQDVFAFNDLNRASYGLGSLYLHWALREKGNARMEFAHKAQEAFQHSLIFEPHLEKGWTHAAMVEALLFQNTAGADQMFLRANENASRDYSFWGDFYARSSLISHQPEISRQYESLGLKYFDALINASTSGLSEKATGRVGKGKLLLAKNRNEEAATNFEAALADARREDLWEIQALLAKACLQQSDLSGARKHLDLSLTTAPEDKKPMLRKYQAELAPR